MQYADTLLQNNQTDAQIVKGNYFLFPVFEKAIFICISILALEDLCILAPATLKSQCKSLIDEYGVYVVELLVQFGGDPNKICKAVKLC